MISRLFRQPDPEYTRLLAMLDFDLIDYADWLRKNRSRLTEMLEYDDVSDEDKSPWLRGLFIHEHWKTS